MKLNLRKRLLKYLMVDAVREDILMVHQAVAGNRVGADSDMSQLLKAWASLHKENRALHDDIRLLMDVFDVPSQAPPSKNDSRQGDPHGL